MKKFAHLAMSIVMLIAMSLTAVAKNNTSSIKGKVIDKNSNEPIPYASVALEGLPMGATTNFEGEFEITNIPVGHHHLIATCVGYKQELKHIDVKVGKNPIIEFEIIEDFIGLDQVVITADRNNVQRKDAPVVVNSISTKLLEQTSAATLADGLVFSPGLRVENDCNNCGFSQVRMNGLEGPYTQILINSRPIFSGLAGVYGLEHIPSNMIQRVEVVRGGGSALFGGNAIAGTINIITKDPISNSFKVGAKYGAIGVGAKNSGGIANDFSVDFNASVVTEDHKSGIFVFGMNREREDWDANDDKFSDLVKIKNLSAGLRAYHRTSDLSKLTLEYHIVDEYRRGGDQLHLPAHMSEVAEQVKHRINSGGLTFDQYLNSNRKSKLSLYTSAQHIDRHAYYGAMNQDTKQPDLASYGKTDDFALAVGAQLFSSFDNFLVAPADITLGVENTYNTLVDDKLGYYDYENKKFIPDGNIADQKSNTIGAYAQSKWDLGFMKFLLGVRVDSYNVKNNADGHHEKNTVINPRANVLFNLNKATQFRLSYAKGYRAPQIFSEDLHIEASGARKIIHQNDENLKEETSNSFTASLDYTKSFGKVQTYFLVEGFYTQLKNPFVQEFNPDKNNPTTLIAKRHNGADGKVKGLNFEFKVAPSYKLDFQMGLTLQSSKYDEAIEHGEPEVDENGKEVKDQIHLSTKNMIRTPERYGYFALNWKPSHAFATTLSGTYTGPMDVVHLAGGLDKHNKPIEKESLVKSPDFMELGINFAYHFDLGRDVKLQFDLGVKNIFNSFQDDFDRGPNRDAGYIYGPMNPRTIYFGVKLGNIL